MDEWIDELAQRGKTRLDYVRGRSVKQSIHRHPETGHYLIHGGAWYDHTDSELAEALARFGVAPPEPQEHNDCCQCDQCKPNDPIRDPNKALGLCDITDPTDGTAKFNEEAQL